LLPLAPTGGEGVGGGGGCGSFPLTPQNSNIPATPFNTTQPRASKLQPQIPDPTQKIPATSSCSPLFELPFPPNYHSELGMGSADRCQRVLLRGSADVDRRYTFGSKARG